MIESKPKQKGIASFEVVIDIISVWRRIWHDMDFSTSFIRVMETAEKAPCRKIPPVFGVHMLYKRFLLFSRRLISCLFSIVFIWYDVSFLQFLVTAFTVYVMTGNTLTPDVAFVSLSLLGTLSRVFSMLPLAVSVVIQVHWPYWPSQQAHDVTITSLLRQNDVETSF